jgi:hemolysin III
MLPPHRIAQVHRMSAPPAPHTYSHGEEIANAVTHGLGAAAAIVALTLLLTKGIPVLSGWELAGVVVYGSSLVALFLASTLYHAIPHPRAKDILKRVDHGAIYVLIAGTYTPFMSITLQSTAAKVLLGVVWAIAVAGVIFKIFFVHRFRWLSLSTYLLMGWLALFVVYELWYALPRAGFVLLLAGGLCFTIGAVFYALKQYRYTHAIWHLWVVAGAACHCVAVGVYVIPSPA